MEGDIANLIDLFGYDAVARAVNVHAPSVSLRLSHVDDPRTATRAGDRHEAADASRFTTKSMKAALLGWAARQHETDRDEAIAWWLQREPDARHSRLDTVRRRFDELVEVGFLRETDTSGQVRRVTVTLAGREALRNLADTGVTR
jgi:ribose 1,5-bisphosphokinase PhnN